MTATEPVREFVTSKDGTRIGCVRRGTGPGVVLVQGAMGTADHYSELAEALAGRFTVHAVDRRGRGLSPKPYDPGHDLARDVEDVDAVLAATDSHAVFGLSSGAIIALQAALTLPRVRRVAVYEPPFYADGISHDGIRRLGREIEQHRYGSALMDALLTAQTAPALLRVLPRPLVHAFGFLVLRVEGLVASGPDTLRAMLPGIRYDFAVVGGMDGGIESFRALEKPVLLLSGTRSQAFLRAAVQRLQAILPTSQRVDLDGLTHAGPWNRRRGGRPLVVAQALAAFIAD